ncbi:MAG: gamma-butyrobetaine hydroxylase-like domain-containing protein [Polyangiales bacterium]
MPAPDPRTTPVHVRSPFKATTTEIEWADGHVGKYPHDILRGYCPCAGCQGHGADIKFIAGGATDIKSIEPVGGYALSIEWGDGHATGIYSFKYLRALCWCSQCVPIERSQERPKLGR